MCFIYSFFRICVGLPASGNLVVFCFSGRYCLRKHAFGILRRDICPCDQGDFGGRQALRGLWTASGSCDALLTVTSFFSINNKKENSGDGECGSAQTTATVLVSVCCSRSQPRIGTIIVLHPEWVRYASSRCSGERRCSRKLHQQEELLAAFYREEE